MSVRARRRGRLFPKFQIGLLAIMLGVPGVHAAELVGATAGELGVSPSGSASYSIPIAVPPGTTGVQPKITLQYDSLAGNGPAGMGWTVGGLATITRCPTSISIDGTAAGAPGVDPVDYDANDKFCLNGERLVPVTGSYGADGTEYRTRYEEFSKVISNGTQGSGPRWFQVWRKSGEILEFGNTADSRIEALAPNNPSVWVWALNKLSDTYGNYETFSYAEDATNGGYRISRIDYTGNAGQALAPYNHIDFIYATRPDPAQTYEAGSKITQDKRLTNIKVYADATLFRDYQITYGAAQSGRSRPVSVKECATNAGGGTDCFAPTTFQWSADGQQSLSTIQVNGGVTSAFEYYNVIGNGDFNGDGRADIYVARTSPEGWKVVTNPVLPDKVWLSNGSGGFQGVSPGYDIPQGYLASFGDFNGDGLTDFYAYKVDGDLKAACSFGNNDLIYLSDGDGTFTKQDIGLLAPCHYRVVASGDFNGDGLSDLFLAWTYANSTLMYDQGRPVVLLGNSNGTLQKVSAAGIDITLINNRAIPATGDFNGDGLTDLYVYRSDKKLRKNNGGLPLSDHYWIAKWTPSGSSGTLTFQDVVIPVGDSVTDQYGIAGSGDYNGDGLTDFYVIKMDEEGRGSGNLQDSTWLSKGDLTFKVVDGFSSGQQIIDERRIVGIGDFNGDGLTDHYVMPTQDSHPAGAQTSDTDYILTSNGDGSFTRVNLTGAGITTDHANFEVKGTGDFDGDGLADLFLFRCYDDGRASNNPDDQIFKSAWTFPDQLATITNGLGLATQLFYKPLTDTTVYTKGAGSAYPVQDVIAPRYVVSQVKADDGIGGQNSQLYTYESLRAHLYDAGNLGFAKMKVTDQAKGIVTESTYSQAWASNTQGLLTKSKTTTPAGVVLDNQDVTWTVASGATTDGTPRLFRFAGQTVTTKKDLNGAGFGTTTETVTYNGDPIGNYGFPIRVKVVTEDPSDPLTTFTKITDNVYDHTPSTWILGRLTSSTVTHRQSGSADIVRSSSFTYSTSKGVLQTETVEPSNAALFYKKSYGYNAFGAINKLTETWGTQKASSIQNSDGTQVANRITTYGYDARSRYKTSEANALSHSDGTGYDPVTGVPNSTTDPNGLNTTWQQDSFGRTTRETRPDGAYSTSERYRCGGTVSCPANAVIKIVTNSYGSDGVIIAPTATVFQDELYREVRSTTVSLLGTSVRVDTIYDGQGRIAQKSEPYFSGAATVYWTTIQYDKLDRPTLTTRPDLSTQSADYDGLTVTSTNELGQTKTIIKDAAGRVVKAIDDAGATVISTYDAAGELVQTRIGGVGNTTSTFGYDIRGNKIADTDPDKGAWTYEYNALGLLAKQTDAKGQVTTMVYDVLGRMTKRTDVAISTTSTWKYDTEEDGSLAKGKLTAVTMPGYAKQIYYDQLQRAFQTVETITGGEEYITTTTFETTSSRVANVLYPSGHTIKYFYNANGHLGTIKQGTNTLWEAVADDERGNITEFNLGGGAVQSTRAYDAQRGWLKSIFSQKTSTGKVVQNLTYTFNPLGNLTKRADDEFTTHALTETIQYDDLNRLKKSTVIQAGTGGWTNIVNVAYDANGLGNILSKSDVGAYTYGETRPGCGGIAGGKHAVTSISGAKTASYCYDENGNMVSGDNRTIAYAPYDLPVSITRGFATVTFAYGPERERYKRVDTTSSGTTTTFYAAGNASERITRPDGTVEDKLYIGGFAVLTKIGTTTTINYLLGDHLGSVDTITDALGAVTQKMSFDAWGKRREKTWVEMTSPDLFDSSLTTRGFTGHEEIDPVELVHMNGRVYDPEIGRFLSADPVVQDLTNTQASTATATSSTTPYRSPIRPASSSARSSRRSATSSARSFPASPPPSRQPSACRS